MKYAHRNLGQKVMKYHVTHTGIPGDASYFLGEGVVGLDIGGQLRSVRLPSSQGGVMDDLQHFRLQRLMQKDIGSLGLTTEGLAWQSVAADHD
jgi:hypothetical protein